MFVREVPLWRQIQRENFTSLDALVNFLQLDREKQQFLLASPRFVLNVPRRLAEKIQKNTLDDPILRQFVPLKEETKEVLGFALDPVEDKSFCKTEKLIQKYQGRALVLATSACAMHCRYCFRQNFPYETKVLGFEKEISCLIKDSSIEEVILSGGDPLSLSNEKLQTLFDQLEEVRHVKRIRFHTRFPIGIPERIDDQLIHILKTSSKQIFFVLHCNHPKELDKDVLESIQKIGRLGIPLLNQSVLLKGVNDDEGVQLELCRTLINHGIIPYYLHLLDLVQGASHFLVLKERGNKIIDYLQKNLSGFAVPRLAIEEPGKPSKTFV